MLQFVSTYFHSVTKNFLFWLIYFSAVSITKMSNQFEFREIEGDLFSAPENYSLAHCVSEDMRMGAGIATIFK